MKASKGFFFVIGVFFPFVSLTSTSMADAIANADDDPLLNEIVVQLDTASGQWPDALSVIGGVNTSDPSTRARLGEPARARYLIRNRILPKFLAMMTPDDPRVILHQSIVLTYPDFQHTSAAELLLRQNATVLRIERGRAMRFSTSPNDPLLTNSYTNVDPTRYQWAAQRLNLASAWEKARGYGYSALLDNGIEVHGLSNAGVHPDLVTNFRSQFSQNFNGSNGVTNPGRHAGGTNSATNVDEEPFNIYDGSGTNVIHANVGGHGTHTAGIIGAQANNSTGVAGTCQLCSLMIGRITGIDAPHQYAYPDPIAIADGFSWMTGTGAQVINNSFGGPQSAFNCSASTHNTCTALDAAAAHDVVVVAAAGNGQSSSVDFPANYSGVIGVAGGQYDASGVAFWVGTTDANGNPFGSNYGTGVAVTGPARDVISTMYTGANWEDGSDPVYKCGDDFPASYFSGYGICTGTSMAAPHVAGIASLARSVNPLASRSDVKTVITQNVIACVGTSSTYCGPGVPDAAKVVTAALGGAAVVNRLTPLFSLYSSDRYDHLYTVAPQMGTAAILGTLMPLSYTNNQFGYASIGPLSPGYSAFPGVPLTGCGFSPPCDPLYPRAMAAVFTTFKNPLPGGPELVPLYRLSYACPSSVPSFCANHEHVSHVYATDTTESWVGQAGYKIDGIEGYVFPKTVAQPAGAVKLCRKYYSAHDDYILFPGGGTNGTDCSAATDGYTPGGSNYTQSVVSTDWIGWVYPASTPRAIYNASLFVAVNLFFFD